MATMCVAQKLAVCIHPPRIAAPIQTRHRGYKNWWQLPQFRVATSASTKFHTPVLFLPNERILCVADEQNTHVMLRTRSRGWRQRCCASHASRNRPLPSLHAMSIWWSPNSNDMHARPTSTIPHDVNDARSVFGRTVHCAIREPEDDAGGMLGQFCF